LIRATTIGTGLGAATRRPASARAISAASLIVPVYLRIPGIDVEADIEQVHIIDGIMEAPTDPWKVGWYSQLSMPGRAVDLVLAGHKDWWDVGPAVFWDLALLTSGSEATITTHDGREMIYAVQAIEEVPVSEPPHTYLTGAGPNALTLMTCAGAFEDGSYDSRLVIRAHRTA
jgi:sortase (surface protein transpeptidase)